MNVTSVFIPHVNWSTTSHYTQLSSSFAVVYVAKILHVNLTLKFTSGNVFKIQWWALLIWKCCKTTSKQLFCVVLKHDIDSRDNLRVTDLAVGGVDIRNTANWLWQYDCCTLWNDNWQYLIYWCFGLSVCVGQRFCNVDASIARKCASDKKMEIVETSLTSFLV